jgi:hypothetical protein
MILMADTRARKLYTVASRGYDASGIGSEIAYGDGVIGVAAREMTPIRISHLTTRNRLRPTIRVARPRGHGRHARDEIPLPGLAEGAPTCRSDHGAGATLGVLFVEPLERRFTYDDEDALGVAAQLDGDPAPAVRGRHGCRRSQRDRPRRTATRPQAGAPFVIRHFAADCSVFLNDDYLIKGVAGAIFWTLVNDYVKLQRTAFTNRELRLDPRIRLPDVSDNLEARLILLERRLVERDACVRIEKTGRGRFRLNVSRPLQLVSVPAAQ